MKRLLFILALFFVPASAFGNTVVTGTVNMLNGGHATSGYVRFWLRGCAGNQPRVNGIALINPSSQGGIFYVDLPISGTGSVSGTLYSTRDAAGTGNGEIECGGSKISEWYGLQVFVNGRQGPEMPIHADNGVTLNITSVQPIIMLPPPAVPGAGVIGPPGPIGPQGPPGPGGGGGNPSGVTTDLQYNNGGVFGGAAGITTPDGNSLSIKGPIPWRDATAYGAVSSSSVSGVDCTAGSPNILLTGAYSQPFTVLQDWKAGQYMSIFYCGPLATVSAPNLSPINISAISRAGNVVTATVAGVGPIEINQYVTVAGFTGGHTAFNGVYWTTSSGGTTITWTQTPGAADDSSSGGTITGGAAIYEGTNPGATTYTYNVCSVGHGGGCSAKSATLTVTNAPAALTDLDNIWLSFGFEWPGASGDVDYLCVYRNNAFIGRTYMPGYNDDGVNWGRNLNCPATPPASATADLLKTHIVSQVGANVVLADAATFSHTSAFAFHDSELPLEAARAAAIADGLANGGGPPSVLLPAGHYMFSRLVINAYPLDATGIIEPLTHPVTLLNGGSLVGHSLSANPLLFNTDSQVEVKTTGTPFYDPESNRNEMDGVLFIGPAGNETLRGATTAPGALSHDIILANTPTTGAASVTIDNFSGLHGSDGDCLYANANVIFAKILNFRCQAAAIELGGSRNRYSIYLTNIWHGGQNVSVDWDIRDLYMAYGAIKLDSPAPNLGAGIAGWKFGRFDQVFTESIRSHGFITVDAGCSTSPYDTRTGLNSTEFNFLVGSDQAAYKGEYYLSRAGTTGCTAAQAYGDGLVAHDGWFTNRGGDPTIGADVPLVINSRSVSSWDGDIRLSDEDLNTSETRIGGQRTVIGGRFFMRCPQGLGDVPCGAVQMTPPDFSVTDGGAGGSCAAGVTYYFAVSASNGIGWTKVGMQTREVSASTGAGGEFIAINFAPGYFSPKYRVWYGTTSGGENSYFETTNQSSYNFGCGAPTGSGTPPNLSDAYWMKLASESDTDSYIGIGDHDHVGIAKNPSQLGLSYALDVGNLINSDKGYVLTETTAQAGISSTDVLYGLSSAHWPAFNPNAAGAHALCGSTGTVTSGHIVAFNTSGTNICDLVDGGTGTGSGTVTNFTAGNAAPLFTTSVATSGTTPALTFAISNAAAHTFYMNNTGGSAAPAFQTAGEADLPATTVWTDQNATFGAHTYDFSGATIFKVKTAAGYAPTVDGQCGVNTTTHLFVCGFNSASTITIPVTNAGTSHQFVSSYSQATGALTTTQPTLADVAAGAAPAGLFDFSTGTFKLPVAAGFATTANGNIGYDTTNKNWHLWTNGADKIAVVWSAVPANGNCAKASVAASVVLLTDAACTGATLQTNGVNNSSQALLNCVDTTGASGIACNNPSGGVLNLSLANVAGGGNSTLQGTLTGFAQGDPLCGDAVPKIINCVNGVVTNAQTVTSYTITGGDGGSSDRGKYLTFTNASAIAIALPQASSAGFGSNFYFAIRNTGAGAVTITPTTSTINGNATLVLLKGMQANILSDNTNYLATVSGVIQPLTFAGLPACSATWEGWSAAVTDSTTVTWGATVTGGSTNHIHAYCDGTNWTVEGK